MTTAYTDGAVFEVAYPFVLEEFGMPDEIPGPSWRPGIRYDHFIDGYGDPDSEAVSDALGKQILTIVSAHKPGHFPTRIFYIQQWEDPNGKRFGKGGLKIKTAAAFTRMLRGYRYEFRLLKRAA